MGTVYTELLRTDYQDMVNAFLESSGPMPPALERVATAGHFKELLLACREKGIRLIAGDAMDTSKAPGAERALTMNQKTLDLIGTDRGGRHDKFVLLVGAQHTHTHVKDDGKGVPPVPGLSQTLELPALQIQGGVIRLHEEDRTKRG